MAVVAMKKTAVNVNHGMVFWKDKIRLSGKIVPVQTVAVPASVESPADQHFWLCVLAPYRLYVFSADFRAMYVGHGPPDVTRAPARLGHSAANRLPDLRKPIVVLSGIITFTFIGG